MKTYKVKVNGKVYLVEVEEVGKGEAGHAEEAPESTDAPKAAVLDAGTERIEAPMQGTLIDIRVSPGDQITKGQVVAVLDAMKMENDLVSPFDGTVSEVPARVGDTLDSGDLILTVRTK